MAEVLGFSGTSSSAGTWSAHDGVATADGTLPRFAYDNKLLTAASVVASSSATGYPVANIYDWRPDNRWKGTGSAPWTITATWASAIQITCWCCFGHSIGTYGGAIEMEWSDDGGSTWTSFGSSYAPASTEVIYDIDTQVAANAVKWTISAASSPPEIGCLFVGPEWIPQAGLQWPFTAPRFSQKAMMLHSDNRDGLPIDFAVEKIVADIQMTLGPLGHSWVQSNYAALMRHAELQQKPMFFHWHKDFDANGAAFLSGNRLSIAEDKPGYMNLSISARADVD
jgi:hypothetical protein